MLRLCGCYNDTWIQPRVVLACSPQKTSRVSSATPSGCIMPLSAQVAPMHGQAHTGRINNTKKPKRQDRITPVREETKYCYQIR